MDIQKFIIKIKHINNSIVDLTWSKGLFNYDFFREVYADPTLYAEVALKALESSNISEQEQLIITFSMQNLALNDYMQFCGKLLILFENKKVSNKVMRFAIFPTYDWNTKLADYYEDTDVNRFLVELVDTNGLEIRIKELIQNEILTGKAKKNIKHLRDIGEVKN